MSKYLFQIHFLYQPLPFQVKEIFTPKRTMFLILIMVIYQMVFIFLLFLNPGPPYDVVNKKKSLYFMSSSSVPSFICFFVVFVSTLLLVVKLKQNVEWRSNAAKQSNTSSGSAREMKAAKCVVAICTIFIICFTPTIVLVVTGLIYPKFTHQDPYLGTLMRSLYALSILMQVLSSSINIFVYYAMGSKYRDVFNALFCRRKDIKG